MLIIKETNQNHNAVTSRRRVVGGGVGVREVGVEAERRAWCPQVIAIGGTAEERENDAAV